MKNKEWPFKYFKREEFCCKCGCGLCDIDLEVVGAIDLVRERYGKAIYISSGCRCPEHNRKVNGSPTSSHLRRLAIDIVCESSRNRYRLLRWLSLYFNRIGIGTNFIHADMDKDKSENMIWLYSHSTGRWE